jgi:histidinol-phosphatase (PHP family)
MVGSCERAVELGLPSIAFTDHADLTAWRMDPDRASSLPEHLRARLTGTDQLRPPDLDVSGYAECVRRCRERFPQLRILFGVELSEPHWNRERVRELLTANAFERVLGSVHSFDTGSGYLFIEDLYQTHSVEEVVRAYLAEVLRMVQGCADFEVLAHIDYPLRYAPGGAAAFDPAVLEEEFRAVLRALAATDRVLEINSQNPLPAQVVHWWYEVGGEAVSFGSDAHEPSLVALRFAETAAMAEAAGFGPGRDPSTFWSRHARSLR